MADCLKVTMLIHKGLRPDGIWKLALTYHVNCLINICIYVCRTCRKLVSIRLMVWHGDISQGASRNTSQPSQANRSLRRWNFQNEAFTKWCYVGVFSLECVVLCQTDPRWLLVCNVRYKLKIRPCRSIY